MATRSPHRVSTGERINVHEAPGRLQQELGTRRIRLTRQQIPAIRAPARLHESSLFQTGQNQLQELLWDGLTACDFRNLDRLPGRLACQIEHGPQRVLTFT